MHSGRKSEAAPNQKAVWTALSYLFLDTELQPYDHIAIANTLRSANLSSSAAHRILLREVAPVFFWNLLATAGEWHPFPEDQVAQLCEQFLARPRPLRWLQRTTANLIIRSHLKRDWQQIEPQLQAPPH